MPDFKRDSKSKKSITSSGLSLQGSQINLSTRLSNFNISNPLHYLYNENVDARSSRGRPMSASTLDATYQDSPRTSKLIKRPQSADTINKIAQNLSHISFDFNDGRDITNSRNHVDLESTFDELDAAELSSDGRSTPIRGNDQLLQSENDNQRELEPGLTSKPPIPPTVGNAQHETFSREHGKNSVTFDDAVELKFQRWFPNSAPAAIPSAADLPLNGMSYEYSERVIDNDKGTITYTRSSSSMSIRGNQDQLDEDHLYSNLSAAIGSADKLKASVSVDLLEVLKNDDNRRSPSVTKSKKKKKTVPVTLKVKKDAPKSKPVVVRSEPNEIQPRTLGKELKKDHYKTTHGSPVDDVKEDVVSWMSSHQRLSTPELNDEIDTIRDENHKTSTYDEIVNILKELESENNDIGS